MILTLYICAFIYLYLFRNVITHSSCVVCNWILWWSRTLCSWEQMVRCIAMENLMLENDGTQCSSRIWHWGMSFCFKCMMFRFDLKGLAREVLRLTGVFNIADYVPWTGFLDLQVWASTTWSYLIPSYTFHQSATFPSKYIVP